MAMLRFKVSLRDSSLSAWDLSDPILPIWTNFFACWICFEIAKVNHGGQVSKDTPNIWLQKFDGHIVSNIDWSWNIVFSHSFGLILV